MLQHAIRCSLILCLFIDIGLAQTKRVTVCKRAALAALQPKPELDYKCGEQTSDWDEKWLKHPVRVGALNRLMSQLSTLTTPAWWQTSVDDLNACDFKGKAGAPTLDERQQFADGDYGFWLFGDNQIRLVLVPDPCYQTEYNGSNAFMLFRKNGRVFVSQVLNGYYSRADNSVSLNFGRLNDELVIEVATGSGGLNPSLTNYYFVIDPKTNKPVPRKLFASKHGPTNVISSAMLFGEVPAAVAPLNIIRSHSLAKSFSIYTEDPDGKIDDNGRTLSRAVRRWNGKLYR